MIYSFEPAVVSAGQRSPSLSSREQEEGAAAERGAGGARRRRGEQEEHGHLSAQRTVPVHPRETEETHSGVRVQDR